MNVTGSKGRVLIDGICIGSGRIVNMAYDPDFDVIVSKQFVNDLQREAWSPIHVGPAEITFVLSPSVAGSLGFLLMRLGMAIGGFIGIDVDQHETFGVHMWRRHSYGKFEIRKVGDNEPK